MFRELGRNNRLVMLALFVWGLGEGLWYYNFRQIYLVELGATEAQVGLALAIEAIVRAAVPIPAGYIANRIGTHRVMVASWFVGMVGPLVGALARTWIAFVPGLAVYALSAFATPSISAYTIQNTPDRSPGVNDRILSTVFAVYPAGLIVSPTLGGLIADRYSIRSLMWISAVLFGVSTAIVLMTRRPPALPDAGNDRPRDLLRNRRFLRLGVYFFFTYVAVYVGYQLVPNFLQEVRGLSLSRIGFLFSMVSVGTVVLSLIAGRTNPRWNMAAAVALYTAAVVGMWQFSAPAALTGVFFLGGSVTVVRMLSLARAADVVSARNQVFAFGVMETMLSVAMAVAAAIAGGLYGLTPGHELPFVAALVALPVLIGLWFAVRPAKLAPLHGAVGAAGDARK